MEFKSINPYDNTEISTFRGHAPSEVSIMLKQSDSAFSEWRQTPMAERSALMVRVAELLEQDVDKYAATMTREMGKPITEARAEINKCAWVCRYYAEHAESFLATESVETDGAASFIRYDPLGTILAIMPWNFPYWQVYRFAVPTLMAGNTALLKHATNVLGCAEHIEQLFRDAGFPEFVFQNLFIDHDQTESVIAQDTVSAVTLTGSTRAGRAVGQLAGKYLKKSVLELGGSNAFVVWKDADLDRAVKTGVQARMMNSGQSCIAAKRFIIHADLYDDYVSQYADEVEAMRVGDPIEEDTEIGPLAREDLAEGLHEQVTRSIRQGADCILGGNHNGARYEPTILTGVTPGMPAFEEETFGPVASMIRAKDDEEALALAMQSKFGLGMTICTTDIDRATQIAGRVPDGALFVNHLVKSDPRLPFGGTKGSGYGRELGRQGIHEFVNVKTVYVGR